MGNQKGFKRTFTFLVSLLLPLPSLATTVLNTVDSKTLSWDEAPKCHLGLSDLTIEIGDEKKGKLSLTLLNYKAMSQNYNLHYEMTDLSQGEIVLTTPEGKEFGIRHPGNATLDDRLKSRCSLDLKRPINSPNDLRVSVKCENVVRTNGLSKSWYEYEIKADNAIVCSNLTASNK